MEQYVKNKNFNDLLYGKKKLIYFLNNNIKDGKKLNELVCDKDIKELLNDEKSIDDKYKDELRKACSIVNVTSNTEVIIDPITKEYFTFQQLRKYFPVTYVKKQNQKKEKKNNSSQSGGNTKDNKKKEEKTNYTAYT